MSKLMNSDVFGISPDISPHSYVDRGDLDDEISRHLRRKKCHIALRGESKCGKSWLRKKTIPDGLVVQCRLKTTTIDIYTDILSQLGIKLIVEEGEKGSIKGKVESTGTFGFELLTKLSVKFGFETSEETHVSGKKAGHDVNDLRFIAELIRESGKTVVIEDFHYLSLDERRSLSFDLKALWDYQCFFVIIGVWTKLNLLIYLNPDLSGRITEIPVHWTYTELKKVIVNGSRALNIEISPAIVNKLVSDCYNNVGLLQEMTLLYTDEERLFEQQETKKYLDDTEAFTSAAMKYAEQLATRYRKFADDVSSGIRKRKDATGIYAHAMAVIIDSSDGDLMEGLHLDSIFEIAHKRQSRIQKQNLRVILQKLEEIQVDSEGRGLVVSFNEATDEISVIDRTLFFYRKYVTIAWPWEQLILECEEPQKSVIIVPPNVK